MTTRYDLTDPNTRKLIGTRVAGIRYRARLYAAAGQPERAARCLALLNEPENREFIESLSPDDGRVKRRKSVPTA